MGDPERDVYQHMRLNGGVITRERAIALGMSERTIRRRVETGQFIAVNDRVVALPGVLLNERSLLGAATSALGAVVTHHSAARLLGVDGLDPNRVTVSVPVRRSNRHVGVEVHQLTDIQPEQIIKVEGLPTTTPARTIVDLAALLPMKQLAEVSDQLVRQRGTTYEEISETLEKLARKGKPGVVKLRRVLEPRMGGTFVSDSTLESRLIYVIDSGGLPLPTTQYRPPWLRHMSGRVDLVYLEKRLLIEGDSMKFHGSPEHFQKDRERDNLAQLEGWRVLRFTWHDITKRPDYVVNTIRQALDASE